MQTVFTHNNATDFVLLVDEADKVLNAFPADPETVKAYLQDGYKADLWDTTPNFADENPTSIEDYGDECGRNGKLCDERRDFYGVPRGNPIHDLLGIKPIAGYWQKVGVRNKTTQKLIGVFEIKARNERDSIVESAYAVIGCGFTPNNPCHCAAFGADLKTIARGFSQRFLHGQPIEAFSYEAEKIKTGHSFSKAEIEYEKEVKAQHEAARAAQRKPTFKP